MNSWEGKRVLIVDDDPGSCYLAKHHLEEVWIREENIVIANDWLQALEIGKKELFDLIIMDIKLPWMDGIQVSQEIKDHHEPKTPKIIATTALIDSDKMEWIEVMDSVLIKPINWDNFSEKILQALNAVEQ